MPLHDNDVQAPFCALTQDVLAAPTAIFLAWNSSSASLFDRLPVTLNGKLFASHLVHLVVVNFVNGSPCTIGPMCPLNRGACHGTCCCDVLAHIPCCLTFLRWTADQGICQWTSSRLLPSDVHHVHSKCQLASSQPPFLLFLVDNVVTYEQPPWHVFVILALATAHAFKPNP